MKKFLKIAVMLVVVLVTVNVASAWPGYCGNVVTPAPYVGNMLPQYCPPPVMYRPQPVYYVQQQVVYQPAPQYYPQQQYYVPQPQPVYYQQQPQPQYYAPLQGLQWAISFNIPFGGGGRHHR